MAGVSPPHIGGVWGGRTVFCPENFEFITLYYFMAPMRETTDLGSAEDRA